MNDLELLARSSPETNPPSGAQARKVVFRTGGNRHGPITRLVSPSDLGQIIKPFVFLDLIDTRGSTTLPRFSWHPHSGIATFTFLLEGELSYADSTGKNGTLPEGGVEWMRAGGGVWHTGALAEHTRSLGFQLWIALPPTEESAAAESIYLDPSRVPQVGPARVLIGHYDGARSAIPAPGDMTYLGVTLREGERWTYMPGADHRAGWLAVASGSLDAGAMARAGELLVFADSGQPIEITATSDSAFVIGSAVKHPHDLVLGNYSVHTSAERLVQGEAEISRLGALLRDMGRLPVMP
jgi:redox-sensitive bicupin YhaK (pirin superfamily)